MPVYEYECPNCSGDDYERIHEVLVPLSEADKEIKCPDCGGALRKLVSAPYFRIN